jgi:aldose 1-epimerase
MDCFAARSAPKLADAMNDSSSVITLTHGAARLRCVPALGGRITACALEQADGRAVPVLHPYPEAETGLERWAKGGIYPLVPYWGRIAQSVLHHAGHAYPLAPHPDAAPHTLHGIAHRRAWTVQDSGADFAVISYRHEADAHWPWPFRAELRLALRSSVLGLAIAVTNTGGQDMPAGIGLHPYLPRGAALRVQFAAERCWGSTSDHLATEPGPVPATADFSAERALSNDASTVFYEGWHSPVTLRHGRGPRLLLSASDTLDHLVLHQPEGAPYLCVEPASHVADAFNLHARGVAGTGSRTLPPGASLAGRMALAWEHP